MLKPLRVLFGSFLTIGSVMVLVAAGAWLHTRNFVASATTADGVVVENVWSSHSRGSHPRVRFRSNGQDFVFESSVGSSPPSYRVGERVPVVYDPGNPMHASIDSLTALWLVPFIFGILGGVFSSIGIVPFLWYGHAQRRDDWLRANGRQILANVERVERNPTVRVNGVCPYRIVCQWLDPMGNQVRVFYSRNLWFDPARYLTGKTIIVLADPNNPRRYLVDTSFLKGIPEEVS